MWRSSSAVDVRTVTPLLTLRRKAFRTSLLNELKMSATLRSSRPECRRHLQLVEQRRTKRLSAQCQEGGDGANVNCGRAAPHPPEASRRSAWSGCGLHPQDR